MRHVTAHTRPKTAVTKKTQRQFACVRMRAINGGAATEPTAVPALIIPIAEDRSVTGNHSATAFVAAGKPPPSPAPRSRRLATSMSTDVAKPWLAHAIDQNNMQIVK